MTAGDGGALIHCRTKYCDFPGAIFQCPQDMSLAELYGFRRLILQTTGEIEELRHSGRIRRAVIAGKRHLAAGLTGYLKDIMGDGGLYTDEGGRPVYGFFAFVWKREELPEHLAEGFPSMESFQELIRRWVLPRWENRYWEQPKRGCYDEKILLAPFPGLEEGEGKAGRANTSGSRLKIYPAGQEWLLLRQALSAAAEENRTVSGCTCFPGEMAGLRSAFMNISCAGPKEPVWKQREKSGKYAYMLRMTWDRQPVPAGRLEKQLRRILRKNAGAAGIKILCRVTEIRTAGGVTRVWMETDRKLDQRFCRQFLAALAAAFELETCRCRMAERKNACLCRRRTGK